jgi:hypothetical protein
VTLPSTADVDHACQTLRSTNTSSVGTDPKWL